MIHEECLNKILANISPSLIKGRDDDPGNDFQWSPDAVYLIELPYATFRIVAELTGGEFDDGPITYRVIHWDKIA